MGEVGETLLSKPPSLRVYLLGGGGCWTFLFEARIFMPWRKLLFKEIKWLHNSFSPNGYQKSKPDQSHLK